MVTMTCMRARTSLNFSLIGPPTAELAALEPVINLPFEIGNDNIHESLDGFELCLDLTTGFHVLWLYLGNSHYYISQSQMSEDTIADINEVFMLYDNKGDGKIGASQLGDVVRSLGQNPCEAEIRKCGYAGNPDARISFEVFLPILQSVSRDKVQNRPDEFVEGFRLFDKENNGYIQSAELRHILTCLGDKLTDEEVDQLFQGQEDAQGNINYEEFVKMVLSG